MKGDIAMKKLDLISDEYIREAEIPEEHDIIVVEKSSFWQKLSNFMNSPLGVAMLCAVVSLSVLAAIVMAGTSKWGGWFPSVGGTAQESGTEENNFESIPPLPEDTEFKVSVDTQYHNQATETLPSDTQASLPVTQEPSVSTEEEPTKEAFVDRLGIKVDEFSNFIDNEGFAPVLSQMELLNEIIPGYTYQGNPLSVMIMHYDGSQGGGCQAYDQSYSFTNDYTEINGEVSYTNTMDTKIHFDNWQLPFDIVIGDTLEEVSYKMESNEPLSFSDDTVLLYRNGKDVITALGTSEDGNPRTGQFTYVETYTSDYRGFPSTVIRTLRFDFENGVLANVHIGVEEQYTRQ